MFFYRSSFFVSLHFIFFFFKHYIILSPWLTGIGWNSSSTLAIYYLVAQIFRTEANEGYKFYLTLFFPFMLTMSNGALLPEKKERKNEKKAIDSIQKCMKTIKIDFISLWFWARIKFLRICIHMLTRLFGVPLETVVIKSQKWRRKMGCTICSMRNILNIKIKKERKKKLFSLFILLLFS